MRNKKPMEEWIAASLKAHREARGMTQDELVEASGVSSTCLGRVERVGNASLTTLVALCAGMGVRLSDVIRRAEQAADRGDTVALSNTLTAQARVERMKALLDVLDGVCDNFDGLRAMVRAAVSEE